MLTRLRLLLSKLVLSLGATLQLLVGVVDGVGYGLISKDAGIHYIKNLPEELKEELKSIWK